MNTAVIKPTYYTTEYIVFNMKGNYMKLYELRLTCGRIFCFIALISCILVICVAVILISIALEWTVKPFKMPGEHQVNYEMFVCLM